MTKKLKKKLLIALEGFLIGVSLFDIAYIWELKYNGICESFDGWISVVIFIITAIFLILDLRNKEN